MAALLAAGTRVATAACTASDVLPDGVRLMAADLLSAEGSVAIADFTLSELGGVNVLSVSDAPGGGCGALIDAIWTAEIDRNLMSAVRLDRAVLPGMIERGSCVVIHVTSIQRELPLPESTIAYAPAKAALSTYSKALSKEVRPRACASSGSPPAGSRRKLRCGWPNASPSSSTCLVSLQVSGCATGVPNDSPSVTKRQAV